jgi:Tfp pilus assembly protein PilV
MAKIRSKRGFTIAEVIIALTIIVIVSISSLSVIASAVSANVVSETNIKAQYFAESAWECFKVSENDAEFENNMKFAEGVDLVKNGESGPYEYSPENGKFKAVIEVAFGDEKDTFHVTVTDSDGETIVELTYEKN